MIKTSDASTRAVSLVWWLPSSGQARFRGGFIDLLGGGSPVASLTPFLVVSVQDWRFASLSLSLSAIQMAAFPNVMTIDFWQLLQFLVSVHLSTIDDWFLILSNSFNGLIIALMFWFGHRVATPGLKAQSLRKYDFELELHKLLIGEVEDNLRMDAIGSCSDDISSVQD